MLLNLTSFGLFNWFTLWCSISPYSTFSGTRLLRFLFILIYFHYFLFYSFFYVFLFVFCMCVCLALFHSNHTHTLYCFCKRTSAYYLEFRQRLRLVFLYSICIYIYYTSSLCVIFILSTLFRFVSYVAMPGNQRQNSDSRAIIFFRHPCHSVVVVSIMYHFHP